MTSPFVMTNRRVSHPTFVALSLALFLLHLCLFTGCKMEESESATLANPPRSGQPSALDTTTVNLEGSIGQVVYVPVYSHIYHQSGSREFNLTATLSIRNTDPENAITVMDVRYYDSNGQLVRRYLEQPLALQPLSSKSYVVEEEDKAGGVGANFVIEWQAHVDVSVPIIEAVMISTAGAQGLSFVSRGEVIRSLD